MSETDNAQQAQTGAEQGAEVQQPEVNNQEAPTIAGEGAGAGQNVSRPDAETLKPPEPVQYDFTGVKMPEGYEINDAESKQFLDVIKDMGLSNENAGALVKFGTEYGKRLVDAVNNERQQQIAEWGETARKELGADLDKTVALCGSAIEQMKDIAPGLREALDETGAGNRIEIVRVLAKLGEMLNGDPGKAAGAGANAGGGQGGTNFKSLYPNTNFDKYRA